MTIELVDEAVASGARIEVACETIGLCARTLGRWRREEGGEDKRRGPHKSPAHKLIEEQPTSPRQPWSWDITYLRASVRGVFYFLYAVVDVWSRKIVGHAVHEDEGGEEAAQLLDQAYEAERVRPGKLILHADNGGPMKGATLLSTLQRLGVAASFSRPRVSDDNPYLESPGTTPSTSTRRCASSRPTIATRAATRPSPTCAGESCCELARIIPGVRSATSATARPSALQPSTRYEKRLIRTRSRARSDHDFFGQLS